MEFKAVNKKEKVRYATKNEKTNKLYTLLIETKKITIPAVIMLLINKNCYAIEEPLSGDIQILVPGIQPIYTPPNPLDIFKSFTPFVLAITLITLVIFNIISNKKYEKILNHDDEKIFKKKKIKKMLFILGIILALWIITTLVLYKLSINLGGL